MTLARKFTLGLAFAATLSTLVVSASAPAYADGWHRGRGGGNGGAIAAGIIGGLALGALAAGAYSSRPTYYSGPSYYDGPYYGPECYWTVRRVYDEWGNYLGRRRVHACN